MNAGSQVKKSFDVLNKPVFEDEKDLDERDINLNLKDYKHY